MDVLGRYRNLIILVGVLFLQVLGLAVQVKRSSDPESTRLIRIWAVDAITPFERALVWVQTSSSNLWHNYFYLRGVRAENRKLQQQLDELRLQQVRLSEDAEQAHRLQKLLAFKEQVIGDKIAAQVIGTSGSDLSQCIYIDKGSDDGIKPDMAVLTADGIVGKVLHVYPSTSQVLMINDQTSGVGAMLEKSRLQGVLKGTPDGSIVLERVMSDEKVLPGDTLISSGGDQIFPKGLPIGKVSKVSPGHELFLNIQVKPAADLSRLEEVLVIKEKQERVAAAADTGRVRAADVLAQRLPSVPDKPPDSATAATGANKADVNKVGSAAGPAAVGNTQGPQATAAKPKSPQQVGTETTGAPKTASADKTTAQGGNPSAAPSASANQVKKTANSPSAAELSAGAAKASSVNSSNSTTPPQTATTHPKPAAPPSISRQPASDSDPH
jgi:rod shape-determining protein MreC